MSKILNLWADLFGISLNQLFFHWFTPCCSFRLTFILSCMILLILPASFFVGLINLLFYCSQSFPCDLLKQGSNWNTGVFRKFDATFVDFFLNFDAYLLIDLRYCSLFQLVVLFLCQTVDVGCFICYRKRFVLFAYVFLIFLHSLLEIACWFSKLDVFCKFHQIAFEGIEFWNLLWAVCAYKVIRFNLVCYIFSMCSFIPCVVKTIEKIKLLKLLTRLWIHIGHNGQIQDRKRIQWLDRNPKLPIPSNIKQNHGWNAIMVHSVSTWISANRFRLRSIYGT